MLLDATSTEQQEQRDGNGSDGVHQRRTDGLRTHGPQVGAEQPSCRIAEAQHFPSFHVECFYDPIAGDGFVQDILNFRKLILPCTRGGAHAAPDSSSGRNNHGNEQQ
jgi:hypothetical protein